MNGDNILKPILKFKPTITAWNRLEGRPRTDDFDKALKAEIRDGLWMLSRQWQMGEFKGDDAASPVLAKIHMKTTALTKYQPGEGMPQALSSEVPLEVKVEHQPIPFHLMGQAMSLNIRLLMGRQWLKLLKTLSFVTADPQQVRKDYIGLYDIRRPDLEDPEDIFQCAHVEALQQLAALANRSMDGFKLYTFLKEDANNHAWASISSISDAADQSQVNTIAHRFVQWFDNLYYQPIEQSNPSWKPSYLEHQFACSAPKGDQEKVLIADEYYHGHLDWYNLDIHPQSTGLGEVQGVAHETEVEKAITLSFIPTGVTFAGMPHTRWWKFEESRTNFGDIKPDTTDLNKLMLLDFGLLYANDWFLLPLTLSAGSIAKVEGLSVTNVFGERIWVEAAGSGSDEDWQRWNMYNLSIRGSDDLPADHSLLLLDSVPKVLESKPLEQVYLLRDEISNMVWGVEAKIPLASGNSKAGKEASHELRAKYQQFMAPIGLPHPLHSEAKVRYQLVNSVPEYWIPFIPVHVPGENREVQLQRAAMPRVLEGDEGPLRKIEPRTSLLREGLDLVNKEPFYLHEEEVPRAGVRIQKSFQRTRWYNGQVFTWIGIRKQVGRGEGFSGLVFDQILPKDDL